jgi:diguanylate cyclase (GGDEF)-like protein/PAS domain S-box-containing protein
MSLRYRIAVTIFALEAVVIAVVLWGTLQESIDHVRAQAARTEEVTIRLLSDLGRTALLTDEFAELQAFIESESRDPRIRAAVVWDIDGRIVSATDVALIGNQVEAFLDGSHTYWRKVEVRGRSSQLGSLAIEFSDYPIEHAFKRTRDVGIKIALVGMVLIALVGLGMGFVLTRRLQSLAHAADRVAASDTTIRVDESGRDEVARVGRAFNSMVDRVADTVKALEAARDRLVQPAEAMSEGFALWDANDRLVLYNSKFGDMFGSARDHLVLGKTCEELCATFHEHVLAAEGRAPFAQWLPERMYHHRNSPGPRETQLHDGRWMSTREFRTPDGGTVGIYTDITEAKQRQRALEHGEQRMRAVMNSVIDGILTLADDGTIESTNPAAAKIFDYDQDAMIGLGVGDLLAHARPGWTEEPSMLAVAEFNSLPPQTLLEVVGVRRGGATFLLELSVTSIDLHGRRMFIAAVRDITKRKAAEESVLYHATHDILTELPNRALFDDRLKTALRHAPRTGEMLAVLFLDLDRFKMINDTLGHTIGDSLLVAVSRRLRSSVREDDTVARMGGDEFIFILRGLRSSDDAVKPAQKILTAIRPPFHVQGHELHITASIGVSVYPADAVAPEQLLRCADVALYRAKDAGRNRLELYNPTMNARIVQQMALESEMRRAVEQQQFVLVYQPQVDLDSGRVVGIEALLRWHHPELGVVPPEQFVPLAEDSGLIHRLGMWVLRTACLQHRAWREAGLPSLRLAINMSARQFQNRDLGRRIQEILIETGVAPDCLDLEITESIVLQEGDCTAGVLDAVSAMGIGLALDDFGTGYSSLSCLKRFPIRRLKLDPSSVRGIGTSDADAALARAVIAMAHGLGVSVIAEGIETMDQLSMLRSYGCDEGQGYLLGRPVPGPEVPRMVFVLSIGTAAPSLAIAGAD